MPPAGMTIRSELVAEGDRWHIVDGDSVLASYDDDQVRLSLSWKAKVYADHDERARAEARTLETQRRQLEVEKRAQATSLRVEKLAQEKLAMRPVTPAITEYVTAHAQAAVASGAREERAR